MSEDIKIYVADLAAYNNGILHGAWINACDDLEDIQEQINEMLKSSPEEDAEEYAIHDHEGFEGYCVSEYSGIDELHEIACFIDENPGIGGALLNQFCDDLDEARRAIEENYYGVYESVADYAEELTSDTWTWPAEYPFTGRTLAPEPYWKMTPRLYRIVIKCLPSELAGRLPVNHSNFNFSMEFICNFRRFS